MNRKSLKRPRLASSHGPPASRRQKWGATALLNPLTSETDSVSIPHGQFGFRKLASLAKPIGFQSLKLFPNEHLLSKKTDFILQGCGMQDLMRQWYNELPTPVRAKVDRTGLKPLIDSSSMTDIDSALILSLGEKWWDTTHTFHFEQLGEMTMTPQDFSSISGLPVYGTPLQFDKSSHRNKMYIGKYLGDPLRCQDAGSVGVKWIWDEYHKQTCTTSEEEDTLVRVFTLALLGSTLFARPNNRVHLYYLPSIVDVDRIADYNWGGAGLAFLYEQMDDLCRGNNRTLGGLCRAWEIWAREYVPSLQVFEPTHKGNIFPRSLRWANFNRPASATEHSSLLDYYRVKIHQLLHSDVNWSPWGTTANLPECVKKSTIASQKRILLLGPDGGEWYLGERVSIQSLREPSFLIPKHPPRSMLVREKVTVITKRWALQGKSAYDFIDDLSSISYDDYRQTWLTLTPIEKVNLHCKTECPTTAHSTCDSPDDVFPLPPWTLLLPSTVGGPNIIRIPTDIPIDNLDIPPHVKQVSVRTAKRLLRMIAGMQHILIEHVTNARDTLRQYADIIQTLRTQLDEQGPINDAPNAIRDQLEGEPSTEDYIADATNGTGRLRDDGDIEDVL